MSEEQCERCRFWRMFSEEDGEDIGTCHRFPPTNTPPTTIRKDDARSLDPWGTGHWVQPTTFAFGWCGEFQDKTVSATPSAPSED